MKEAHSCLVATCTHLCLTTVRDANFDMWIDVLRMVLRDCGKCPEAMLELRENAQDLVDARTALARTNALMRLNWTTKAYFTNAAGARFEAWKDQTAGLGVVG